MAAVAPREGERLEQPQQQLIEHGAVVSADLAAQGASNSALAVAGRADDEQILMPVDPLVGDEFLEQRLVEPRGAFTSISWRRRSAGGWRTAIRATSRLFSRSVASWSTSSARRSSRTTLLRDQGLREHNRQQSDRCGFGLG
ncbi:MAG: hypothetical protein ACOY3N_10125 [Bradyrhizobium sp.]|uniref:hypothetical protein n=1 Tax=Bradyrhizobium sp. TaxID=376 RepID=UPI003BF00950